MNEKQRVECTKHGGAHKGVVVQILAPGVGYGVAWDDRNLTFGKPEWDGRPQYPTEFKDAGHGADLVWCDAANIRAV